MGNGYSHGLEADEQIVVSIEGEGAGKISQGKDNLIVEAAMKLAELAGKELPAFKLSCVNHIPMSSGLGSSSAAILTGMLGADALLGEPFSRNEILKIAAEMEGHADNVSPALLGGLTLSSVDVAEDKVIVRQIPIGMDLHVTVVLPDFHLPTKEARAALPKQFSMKDAVHNISHAALVLEAFRCGDLSLLARSDDRYVASTVSDEVDPRCGVGDGGGASGGSRGSRAFGSGSQLDRIFFGSRSRHRGINEACV